ncbi:MAG: hypothetical protein O3B13_22715 [Planctomycetota bacterium]|nr:hypothetical protein [Planctomycetota bacterium]MDA1165921.1 hypothetical protein [Planctomycetota bacterium]
MISLNERYDEQRFANDYQLVNGVVMHEENGDNFRIPPDVIKKHIGAGQFVELRIDSPRFSVHEGAAEQCNCPSCNGEMTKPILRHEHPASLVPLPDQMVPSRGWGEDFWVRVTDRDGQLLKGKVDNPLIETRLHELQPGSEVFFHEDHILAVHGSHRPEMLLRMNAADLKELAEWLGIQGK